jgi:hypothetical protein
VGSEIESESEIETASERVAEITGSDSEDPKVGTPGIIETDHEGKPGCESGAVGEGGRKLIEPLPEPMGRAELRIGMEETEQIVVVMLTTVVEVSTTVALAGQFEASVAHLVTVNVDVVRTTAVVTSLRARGTSVSWLEKVETGD